MALSIKLFMWPTLFSTKKHPWLIYKNPYPVRLTNILFWSTNFTKINETRMARIVVLKRYPVAPSNRYWVVNVHSLRYFMSTMAPFYGCRCVYVYIIHTRMCMFVFRIYVQICRWYKLCPENPLSKYVRRDGLS